MTFIDNNFSEHLKVLNDSRVLNKMIIEISELITQSLKNGNKIIWCGNGGSAADSMHLSTELIGRYKSNRKSLSSISLSADSVALTCIANDFGYEYIFSRQIEGVGKSGDVLVCLTTSGNSLNVEKAIITAKHMNIKTILMSGNKGGKCSKLSDFELIIPSESTARIQEMQIFIGHIICDYIEVNFN
jgi:D-sedoheptulose 7-phosphate isomerase